MAYIKENVYRTALLIDGTTVPTSSIGLNGYHINNLVDPIRQQDVATKNYVDGQGNLRMAKVGDTMTGNLLMGSNRVTDVSLPVSDNDVTNKAYLNEYLEKVIFNLNTYINGRIVDTRLAGLEIIVSIISSTHN